MQQNMSTRNDCCVDAIVTQIILKPALLFVFSVNQTDTSWSPAQPLKPQAHFTSKGLETDPQPEELFPSKIALLTTNSAPDRGKQKQHQQQ